MSILVVGTIYCYVTWLCHQSCRSNSFKSSVVVQIVRVVGGIVIGILCIPRQVTGLWPIFTPVLSSSVASEVYCKAVSEAEETVKELMTNCL